MGTQANQLIHEKSPYLLQHAHNPVQWLPWGEEAFRKSREENKPIFLSVGYSTCHWCHVMERESFENHDIAGLLNRYFVPVKVDREERPDVDRIYMVFVQATTGAGGWPMSVFLTPDLKPFFGGTYFPPQGMYGRPGFREILERVAEAWRNERGALAESSEDILEKLRQYSHMGAGRSEPDTSVLDKGFWAFRRMHDSSLGGFGGPPKFPRPAVHNFLLRYHHRTHNVEALDMVLKTLQEMARGGMCDQLGGGFHRYSVDERWFVPHFEKMLYDQAQLAISYLEAFQITGDRFYADVARLTLDYVLRDMTDSQGGFYSAEDADSIDPARPDVKREGAFYLWTQTEIQETLGDPAADWFCYRYGIVGTGNVREDPHHEFVGKNILFQAHTLEETAAHAGKPLEDVRSALNDSCRRLLERRAKRPRPHLDDKVLTAWNGLMISAFAKGWQVLEDSRYLEAARRAADFIRRHLFVAEDSTGNSQNGVIVARWDKSAVTASAESPAAPGQPGILMRRYREGEAAIAGFLDDYAFFAQGLLDLYEAGFDPADLELALQLTESQLELFEDKENGGFFSTAASGSDLVLRMKDDYDGAEPSGNSIVVQNLLRLAAMADRRDLRDSADRALRAFSSRLTGAPEALPQLLAALELAIAKPKQIILAGALDAEDTNDLLRIVNRRFLPHKFVMLAHNPDSRHRLSDLLPVVESMVRVDGTATAYVCEDYTCRLPVHDAAGLEQLLSE